MDGFESFVGWLPAGMFVNPMDDGCCWLEDGSTVDDEFDDDDVAAAAANSVGTRG